MDNTENETKEILAEIKALSKEIAELHQQIKENDQKLNAISAVLAAKNEIDASDDE